jgi:hypothetical protein
MVTITADPTNPDRLIVTQTVTLYLDRVLLSSLSAEVEAAIRAQAVADLKSNSRVKKQIAAAATSKLLSMLGVPPEPATVVLPGHRAELGRPKLEYVEATAASAPPVQAQVFTYERVPDAPNMGWDAQPAVNITPATASVRALIARAKD